jgi:hypothetical protein
LLIANLGRRGQRFAGLVSKEFLVDGLAADSKCFLDPYLKLFHFVECQRFQFDLYGTSCANAGKLR